MERECEATRQRRQLIAAMYAAIGLHHEEHDGSEDALFMAWSHLEGVVAEYTNGGDQMAEECTCPDYAGEHRNHDRDPRAFVAIYAEWRARHGMGPRDEPKPGYVLLPEVNVQKLVTTVNDSSVPRRLEAYGEQLDGQPTRILLHIAPNHEWAVRDEVSE